MLRGYWCSCPGMPLACQQSCSRWCQLHCRSWAIGGHKSKSKNAYLSPLSYNRSKGQSIALIGCTLMLPSTVMVHLTEYVAHQRIHLHIWHSGASGFTQKHEVTIVFISYALCCQLPYWRGFMPHPPQNILFAFPHQRRTLEIYILHQPRRVAPFGSLGGLCCCCCCCCCCCWKGEEGGSAAGGELLGEGRKGCWGPNISTTPHPQNKYLLVVPAVNPQGQKHY